MPAGNEPNGDQPPKFSRYRSLRGKSVSTLPSTVTRMSISNSGHEVGQQQEAASGKPIARSTSRYRPRANSVAVHGDATQEINSDPPAHCEPAVLPPVAAIPRALKGAAMGRRQREADGDPDTAPDSPPPPRRHQLRHTDAKQSQIRRKVADHESRPSTTSDESQRRRMTDPEDRRRRLDRQDDAARQAERDRLLAEQKKKDLQRLEAQLANNQRPSTAHKPMSPVIKKFVLFTKGRKKDGLSPSSSTGSVDYHGRTAKLETPKAVPTYIEPGGKGIVPQTDAPTSAINSGDRNVTVRCRHHTFNLEITPETTPVDILFQTSNKMTYDLEINPSSCVLIEQYGRLGLERCIRRYERIRDVMNSWDRDTQNQLVVTVAGSDEQDRDLDVHAVPKDEQPQGFQLYMYHSNRPGKWNKRYITLLANGQVVCAKKPNAHTQDKDTASLCRLSDYDIYTPTESQMRRHLKPPKRYCFAVKSQQKTTVFENTDNYVQYFSTEDPKIAAQFREKVQGWRSWYLVDRRPEARKPQKVSVPKTDEKPPQIAPVRHALKKSINVAAMDGHHLRVSVDESPYSIGPFEPLLDMKRFDKRLSQFGKDFLPPVPDASTMPKRIPTQHRRPSKDGGGKTDQPLIGTIKSASDEAFTGGLLGEGYNERKQSLAEAGNGARTTAAAAAFTEGPSLLNRPAEPDTPTDKPESPSWFPSAMEHTAKQRTSSSAVRPNTSAGVMHTSRRPSFSASSRPPLPPPISNSSSSRPTTQGRDQRHTATSPPVSYSHPHPSHPSQHPNPLASQPIGSISHSNRRERPKPLVNLTTPTFQEPPQWSKENKGRGVQAPEGMQHLIDFISVGDAGGPGGGGGGKGGNRDLLEVPPRSTLRRQPHSAPAMPLSRARSKSSGAPPGRVGEVPPVPLLPGLQGQGGRERGPGPSDNKGRDVRGRERERGRDTTPRDREREREKDREREREKERERAKSKAREREKERERERFKEREAAYNAVPGRTGTLKVV
ncbi:Uu.00g084270.m01.CDS01 [Anthostomella pinea]|uniref:Uu.00g084270.m01.CDS01 n=1 Tax=Anthostomella pinea TaxID=933095 RepID=A0AAI8VMN0_9PEZI|nr:Uu.00g084270.m01.CDS01 [Anthostomella pinea]